MSGQGRQVQLLVPLTVTGPCPQGYQNPMIDYTKLALHIPVGSAPVVWVNCIQANAVLTLMAAEPKGLKAIAQE